MRGPEGKIQDKVLAFAKKNGILYKKQEVGRFFVSSGWPDVLFFPDLRRLVTTKGALMRPFFMEFKKPGGKLTPIQKHRRAEIEKRGYRVFVVDSAEQGILYLERECL